MEHGALSLTPDPAPTYHQDWRSVSTLCKPHVNHMAPTSAQLCSHSRARMFRDRIYTRRRRRHSLQLGQLHSNPLALGRLDSLPSLFRRHRLDSRVAALGCCFVLLSKYPAVPRHTHQQLHQNCVSIILTPIKPLESALSMSASPIAALPCRRLTIPRFLEVLGSAA